MLVCLECDLLVVGQQVVWVFIKLMVQICKLVCSWGKLDLIDVLVVVWVVMCEIDLFLVIYDEMLWELKLLIDC